jgi:imidazolonepropionase-like amidohydrolase
MVRTHTNSSSWCRPVCRPCFALQAATTHAAELLKHDKELGSLSAGKFADVVAVHGSPLDDISLMKRVSFVLKDGVVYKRDGNSVLVETLTTMPAGTAGTAADS